MESQTNQITKQVQAYKELTSVKKLQEFYRKDVKVDAFQAEKTVLKGSAGMLTLDLSNYKGSGLKGLLKLFRTQDKLESELYKHKGLKLHLDATFRVKDSQGKVGEWGTRTRPYTLLYKENSVKDTLSMMVKEMELLFHEEEMVKEWADG